jgi:hypothetical protein
MMIIIIIIFNFILQIKSMVVFNINNIFLKKLLITILISLREFN